MTLPDRLAFDTETELVEPGHRTPRLVCVSLARPEGPPKLLGREAGPLLIKSYLVDPSMVLIGHNIAYDFGALAVEQPALEPLIWSTYEAGRVRDTGIRQQLIDIRSGRAIDGKGPSLDELSRIYQGGALNKGADSWRYWYGDLMGVPLDKWPREARDYALTDAATTLRVCDAQQDRYGWGEPADYQVSADEGLQTRTAWCLHLMSCWGFRTDGEEVARLKAALEQDVARAEASLSAAGIYVREEISKKRQAAGEVGELKKNMQAIKDRVFLAYSGSARPVPMTDPSTRFPTGQVATDKDTLISSGDPVLEELAEAGTPTKLLTTFIPLVERGTRWPVTPRWNAIVRSGRTSCGSPDDPGNWQNPARKGGIRECVIPRPGQRFIRADYSQLELCTLAQVLLWVLGSSEMARAINAGEDLHLSLAISDSPVFSTPPALTYPEAVKLKKAESPLIMPGRQLAKIANFGLSGAMGAETFQHHVKIQTDGKVRLTLAQAEAVKRAWLNRWTEIRAYFAWIKEQVDLGRCIQFGSGRVRGNPGFCDAANTYFQGLAADGAKLAMWAIQRACYTEEDSPLYGFRLILFLHDEFILEGPIERCPEAAEELVRLMIWAMRQVVPDVLIKAEPAIMDRWYKKASEVRGPDGRLALWKPK